MKLDPLISQHLQYCLIVFDICAVPFEKGFEIADLKLINLILSRVVKSCSNGEWVFFIYSADDREDHGVVKGRSGDRSDLVHRPTQCHGAVPTHAAESRPKSGDPVSGRGRDNRA